MNISALFIRRPIMTTLVMVGILLVGIQGYRALPVSDLPNVDFPTLTVSASLPGANPETMASSVATPLERQFSTIAGISSMTSSSSLGSTQVTLQFSLDRDIDAAAQDVQSAIMQALRQLPRDMPNPPSIRKVNPTDSPIIYLTLTSSMLPLSTVDEYAQTMVAQRISMLNGVAQVQIYGSQKYAVRIQVDPHELASRKIGINELSDAIQSANVNLPTGSLQGEHQTYTIQTSGELMTAEKYEPVVVAWRNGAPVRLGDVATVVNSVENLQSAGWYNDTRSVTLAVQRQPGTNTIAIVDSIKELLPTFRETLPPSVTLGVLFDRSTLIRESLHDVQFTFVLTVCLVVLVIFLFLRNLTATIIPTLAMVLSVVGSFAAMYLLGFSLDNLSLMALTLSVGFVVDDAIVMLENIVRRMEEGEQPLDAAFRGSSEIGFTIVSMTISLVAVFIPVLFMGGIVGRLLHEFAVTISVAIIISGFVSLTLTPMLAARFLRPYTHRRHGVMYNALERVFNAMLWMYEGSLRAVMRVRLLTMLGMIPLLVLTAFMFTWLPKGFLPSEDTGQIIAMTEAAQGTAFDAVVGYQQEVVKIIAANPNVQAYSSSVMGSGGRIFITLKPRREREPIDDVIQTLRKAVAGQPGIKVYMQNRPAINVGGQFTKSQYQFTLQATETEVLYEYAPKLEARCKNLPGLLDVTTDLLIANPEVQLAIDRDKAASLGISMEQIQESLFTAYGTRQISSIFAPNNQYNVILEVLPELQRNPEALKLLYVRAVTGELVPLDGLATISKGVGPLSITHLGQFPSVTLSFNLERGYSLGDAVEAVTQAAREELPDTISTSFQGTAQAFESSMAGTAVLLFAAILVIYFVLGILYESFIHPITILSGLPSAGLGALLTLWLFGLELNLFSMVGMIMLVGIVKKNAIMMIDFAIDAQRDGSLSPEQAIIKACKIRFRPIMMTTMAALMGTLPIAIGLGAGAESRRPLGLAVVGGLILSQFLTLYITPVFYVYLDTLHQRLSPRNEVSVSPAEDRPETA